MLKAKDLDMAHLPDTRHLEFAELQAALGRLTELVEEFKRLAGFASR
jgi:hypothetical protein